MLELLSSLEAMMGAIGEVSQKVHDHLSSQRGLLSVGQSDVIKPVFLGTAGRVRAAADAFLELQNKRALVGVIASKVENLGEMSRDAIRELDDVLAKVQGGTDDATASIEGGNGSEAKDGDEQEDDDFDDTFGDDGDDDDDLDEEMVPLLRDVLDNGLRRLPKLFDAVALRLKSIMATDKAAAASASSAPTPSGSLDADFYAIDSMLTLLTNIQICIDEVAGGFYSAEADQVSEQMRLISSHAAGVRKMLLDAAPAETQVGGQDLANGGKAKDTEGGSGDVDELNELLQKWSI